MIVSDRSPAGGRSVESPRIPPAFGALGSAFARVSDPTMRMFCPLPPLSSRPADRHAMHLAELDVGVDQPGDDQQHGQQTGQEQDPTQLRTAELRSPALAARPRYRLWRRHWSGARCRRTSRRRSDGRRWRWGRSDSRSGGRADVEPTRVAAGCRHTRCRTLGGRGRRRGRRARHELALRGIPHDGITVLVGQIGEAAWGRSSGMIGVRPYRGSIVQRRQRAVRSLG